MKTADNNSRSARPTARMNKFSQIKNIIPLAISICLLVPLFYYQDLNFDLFSFFNIKLFSIFIVICMLVSSVGSVRLYANLKSFYNGITLRVVHKINAYSMVSGLFFAGMIGATVTKITLPALGKANKSLVILISIVEKSITFGIMFIIGMASVLKLNNQNLLAVINMPGEFDLLMLIAASLVIVFLFLRTYILEYVRLVAVFLPNTILFSVLIVLLNLIPPYLVLNNILEVSFFQKILYATALMFIGSLPISFKGIGAREVAATILLSQYELSSSVIIGNVLMLSFSEIVAIILLPITTISFGSVTRTFEEKKNKLLENALNYIENNMMLISIPCILLCLFETKIFILNNPVSVTFGDFFAIFLSFTLIGLFFEKNIDPALRRIFILLLSIFSYFCFCFVVGFMDFGFSEWAFYNKLLGGFVLLGYVHAGFLFARLDKQTIQKVFRFIIIIMSVYLLIFLA
ncbi:MAG: hypothetical protein GY729_17215, partial [Desulfobacteraceae bacterium]|nr:hypothetical protein [Desulfobacteraceae bacterium]